MKELQIDPTIQKYDVVIRRYFNSFAPLGESKVIYYKLDLPLEVVSKWKWYFYYRAALFQIETPRNHVGVETFIKKVAPTVDDKIAILQNRLRNAKGKVTEFERKIELYKQNFARKNPMFSEEYKTEDYYLAMDKINAKKFLVKSLTQEIEMLKN